MQFKKEPFMTYKPWKKPELITLTRSNPEESVLAFCKNAAGPAGPSSGHFDCSVLNAICNWCDTWSAT